MYRASDPTEAPQAVMTPVLRNVWTMCTSRCQVLSSGVLHQDHEEDDQEDVDYSDPRQRL